MASLGFTQLHSAPLGSTRLHSASLLQRSKRTPSNPQVETNTLQSPGQSQVRCALLGLVCIALCTSCELSDHYSRSVSMITHKVPASLGFARLALFGLFGFARLTRLHSASLGFAGFAGFAWRFLCALDCARPHIHVTPLIIASCTERARPSG